MGINPILCNAIAMGDKSNLMASGTLQLNLLWDKLEWLGQILKDLIKMVLLIQARKNKL